MRVLVVEVHRIKRVGIMKNGENPNHTYLDYVLINGTYKVHPADSNKVQKLKVVTLEYRDGFYRIGG